MNLENKGNLQRDFKYIWDNNSQSSVMIKLIDRYGIEIVKKGKNCYYSPELKQEIIIKFYLKVVLK